jgi:hypothetical protein
MRNPPRLATWLLGRFGFDHQNPPLAGDLLEEFQNGRSAAWYWRQTLGTIFGGLGRNAGRRLTGSLIGWAAQFGVAFALRRFHVLPEPPAILQTIASIAVAIFFLWLIVFFSPKAPKVALKKAAAPRDLPDAKSMAAHAWNQFIELLLSYCGISLLLGMDQNFGAIQAMWLYLAFREDLGPRRYFQR